MTVLCHLKGSRVGVVSYDRPVPSEGIKGEVVSYDRPVPSEGIKGGGGIVRPSCTI